MKYNYLLFDLDNTLYDFDQSERIALSHTLATHGLHLSADFLAIYKKINKACWKKFENGEISQSHLRYLRYELFLKAVNLDADPVYFGDLYLSKLADCDSLFPETLPLLDKLSDHFKLLLISNGLKEVQRPKIRKSGIYHYFESIIISDEIGVAKPHPGFFDHVFEQLNHPAKEKCLVIGDNLNSDIRGGINYKLDTCWFNFRKNDQRHDLNPTHEIHKIDQLYEVLEI